MIIRENLYVLDYYKKNTYMGSDGPLYFRIHKVEEGEGEEAVKKIEAIAWPGPLIFDKTDDDKKKSIRVEYSEEGMQEITKWLNEEHDCLIAK